ncbi:MAG: glutamate racemase [PVC group bacterium]|nr:glutamate racemase [PVC group bacterium]
MKTSRPIGIFDSGMGGLTVVKEITRILPQEDIVYFGDTARVPYGPKSEETVIRFSIENILFLLKYNVKLIVVACNTASSVALPTLKKHFKIPLLGVIEPGAEKAVGITKNRKVGVIGTKTTIKSGAYKRNIKENAADVNVYSASCPLFVPLVEEGWFNHPITKKIAYEYLDPLKAKGIDSVVLGCTHYPLLKPVIRQVLGKNVALIDSAKQVAQQSRLILEQNNLIRKRNKSQVAKVRFFVSDEPENFARQGSKFLGVPLHDVRKVSNV